MDNLYKKVPVRCPLTVRQQPTLVFAVLTALILFVAGFGIYALGDTNRGFDNYVHGIDARASKASDLRTAIDERAIAARNIVLATSPTDAQGEKTRAVVAHEKVQAHLTELKRMVASAEIVTEIRRVSEIVTEISAANAEQSTGVSQVGDAGIRLGENLAQDVVAVPLGGRHRIATVASPRYLAGRTPPRVPQDLIDHRCLNARLGGGIYRWEFSHKGRDIEIDVPSPLVSNARGAVKAPLRSYAPSPHRPPSATCPHPGR